MRRVITTTAPPDRVWAFLADFTTTEQWDPPTVSTDRVGITGDPGGDGGVGTVYENRSKVFGREVPITYTVVEHDPPQRLVLHGHGSSFRAVATIEIAAHAGGSAATYTADYQPHGLTRLAGPLLGLFLRRTADRAADRMESSFEELVHPAG